MPRPKPQTDLARLEELAARVKPGGAPLLQKEIAAELGIAEATFNQRLARDADMRAALTRGRLRARSAVGRAPAAESGPAGESTPAAVPGPAAIPNLGARARVLDAISGGARSYGKLLTLTRLDHTALTVALQGLTQLRVIFPREVGGERQYFLNGEIPPAEPSAAEVARGV